MTANPALEYLHTHWALPDQPPPPPPGPAWRRLAWRVAGRLTFGSLERYLAEERELLSRAVQVCDTLARRVDTLEAELDTLAQAASGQLSVLATYLPDPTGAEPPAAEPARPEAAAGAGAAGTVLQAELSAAEPVTTDLSAVEPPAAGPSTGTPADVPSDVPGDGTAGGGEPGR